MKEKRKLSKYQEDILKAVITTKSNIVIDATAGSGKTSTLVEISKILPYNSKAIFVAFNNHIVNELKERLPKMECSTLHALGYRCLWSHYSKIQLKDRTFQTKFIEPFFTNEESQRKKWKKIFEADQLSKLIRATMTDLKQESIKNLCENHNLLFDNEIILASIKACKKIREYQLSDRSSIIIDFLSMIEIPAIRKDVRIPEYDYVLVDEIQDMGPIEKLLIEKIISKKNGRLIAVGDRDQSCYLFRGADPSSFDKFEQRNNTLKLPLSISYRCAKNIVKEAKKIYGKIEEYEYNEDGIVKEGKLQDVQEGDFVICRNLRPLMYAYLQLVKEGKKAYILGKDLEKGLIALLNEFEDQETTNNAIKILREKLDNLADQLRAKGISSPTKHYSYIQLEERIETLMQILVKFDYICDAELFLEEIFNDEETDGIKLMTIHKSKGLECNRVFVIEKFENKKLIPSPYAVTQDQKIQEQNLLFVSRTRAKKELIYLYL